eukprot:CAMPEP_0116916850 /NCGR_PEP_ID=MMETSP0467-20121206/18784_1 /TAXON_ID=283647 /ORGANISM="Mesodinium pulex, Strain SPMC105" /LENGTH=116 /DNA_ID=CAMNT_0004593813 /DNA_START=303 /DNA_END=653 /DNA_ORIENTATION=+
MSIGEEQLFTLFENCDMDVSDTQFAEMLHDLSIFNQQEPGMVHFEEFISLFSYKLTPGQKDFLFNTYIDEVTNGKDYTMQEMDVAETLFKNIKNRRRLINLRKGNFAIAFKLFECT